MNTSALHPFPQLPHLSATFPGDQMLLDEDFQSRHCFVALAFINQKDQKPPLPIFSSPPSFSVPSRMTCGSAASKCFKSLRQRPLALETFGAETGGVVWSKHSREENTKNSERRISTHGTLVCISCSQWFSSFSMSLQRLGSHMVCYEQVRRRGLFSYGFRLGNIS